MDSVLHSKSDEELLRDLQQHHNRDAFHTLVKRHTQRFYALAFRLTGSKALAEDCVQDAFLKLWENPALWKSGMGAKFTTWFTRILMNKVTDHHRRTSKIIAFPTDRDDENGMTEIADNKSLAADALLENDEKEQLMQNWLQALPERQQQAMALCFYQGLSNQQAADTMKLGLKALQSLLSRAKATLKQQAAYYNLLENPSLSTKKDKS